MLRKPGKKLPWAQVQVKKVPNLFLLLALIDRLRYGGLRQNA
ncbi:hypothetical protein ACH4VM_05770 [Streptomyces sp. NPDC020792]